MFRNLAGRIGSIGLLLCGAAFCSLLGCSEKGEALQAETASEVTSGESISTAMKPMVPTAASGIQTNAAAPSVATPSPEREPAQQPGLVISGRVLLPDGAAAPGTTVTVGKADAKTFQDAKVTLKDRRTTVSDEAGAFRLNLGKVRPGQPLLLQARRKGSVRTLTAIVPRTELAAGAGGSGIIRRDIVMHPPAPVSGWVVDETSRPLEGVRIRSMSEIRSEADILRKPMARDESVTAADGSFALDEMATGSIVLSLTSPDRAPVERKLDAPATEVTIHMSGGAGIVRGQVYSFGTREGVAGATVTLERSGRNESAEVVALHKPHKTNTDEIGEFAFENLAAGDYRISAASDKMRLIVSGEDGASGRRLQLGHGETTQVALYLYPGHTIRGVVRERAFQTPIHDVRVTAAGRSAVTDAEGKFVIPQVFTPAGRGVSLIATKKGYTTGSGWEGATPPGADIVLRMDELNVSVDVELMAVITVSGTVKSEDGSPISGAHVTGYSTDVSVGLREQTHTDDQGKYRLKAKGFTRMSVTAKADGYPLGVRSEHIEVMDEPVADADIVVKPGTTVEGLVVTADGTPARAKVSATSYLELADTSYTLTFASHETDDAGRFILEGVPRSEVRLQAIGVDHTESEPVTADLSSGRRNEGIRLVLSSARCISGRVTNLAGRPVAAAEVSCPNWDGFGVCAAAMTDEEGKYRLTGLPEGTVDLTVVHPAHAAAIRQGVSAGRDSVDFVLDERGGAPAVPD